MCQRDAVLNLSGPTDAHHIHLRTIIRCTEVSNVTLLIISPQSTYKTGHVCPSMHLRVHRLCGVNIFKTLTLQDCSADTNKTWHRYSYGSWDKTSRKRILNSGPCSAWDQPKLSPVGRDDPPRVGCLLKMYHIKQFFITYIHDWHSSKQTLYYKSNNLLHAINFTWY